MRKFGGNPKIQIDVDVKSNIEKSHGDNIYEVELLIKAETKVENESLFITEATYCGVFTVENAEGELLDKDFNDRMPKVFVSFFKICIGYMYKRRRFSSSNDCPSRFCYNV